MDASRITIGIDPGPRESAIVVWDGVAVLSARDVPNAAVPHALAGVSATIACEWIECFGMAVGREVFETVFAVGTFSAAATLRLIPRRDVKLHVCASPKAKDANIRQALIDRFGVVGTRKKPGPLFGISNHRWAALAVAVTAHDLPATDHEPGFHRPAGAVA
jgi:hypothetical protein